jgi:hypothetical protein
MLVSATISFESNGRSGYIHYKEHENSIKLYWEFGASDVVVNITFPPREKWKQQYSWAVDRQEEIISKIADEAIRVKAPTCKAVISYEERFLDLVEDK